MAKKCGFKSRKNCIWPERKTKSVVAAAKEVESKKIANQLELNASTALKCLFEMARQGKKNNQDIVGMPCIRCKDGNITVSQKDKMERVRRKADE